MTKPHRKSCPPHPRLGAQPMRGSHWREWQSRTPTLCPAWHAPMHFCVPCPGASFQRSLYWGDFGRSLSQMPLLIPLYVGDAGVLKTLFLHSDPALSTFLFPAPPFSSCSAPPPAPIHKTLRAFRWRLCSQRDDSPQLGWSTGPTAEP